MIPRPRCLVIRRGGLGDTLLLTPVLRALRRARPTDQIELAGVHEFAAVLQHYGVVDRALSSESLSLWSPARAAERLAGCAAIYSDDPAAAAAAPPGAVVGVYDPRPRDRRPLPAQLAAAFGVVLQPGDAELAPRAAAAGPLWLAPGSGGRAKCWPRPRWLELAAALRAAGLPLQVVVGPTEVERDDPRGWPWPAGTGFLPAGSATALALALQAARGFVGNDSGPSHLAALLGVPVVAVFGPSDPAVYAPQGPRVQVVEGGADFAAATVPVVRAALARALA